MQSQHIDFMYNTSILQLLLCTIPNYKFNTSNRGIKYILMYLIYFYCEKNATDLQNVTKNYVEVFLKYWSQTNE